MSILSFEFTPLEEGVEIHLISRNRKTLFPGITGNQMIKGCTAYYGGKLIQDAFGFLTADQREFLMTGMYPEEWEVITCPDPDE